MYFYDRRTDREIGICFRQFETADGPQLRRCISDFYGDGYPYKKYLDAEYLSEKCRENRMAVLCGMTPEGEMVSLSAVRFDSGFPGSAMLLLRVVKERFRGLGIGAVQEKLLFEILEKREGLFSVYADVMTHNTVSQGSLIRRGFIPCAIRPALYRRKIMVPGIPCPDGARLSQAVLCRKENADGCVQLYCPGEHRAYVERIYGRLGQRFRITASGGKAETEHTEVFCKDEPEHSSCIWLLRRPGRDIGPVLARLKERAAGEGRDVILCYLNVSAPGAGEAYRGLRSCGFWFSGMKPLNRDGEYMLLAETGDRPLSPEEICMHPEGEELFDYIRTAYEQRRRL